MKKEILPTFKNDILNVIKYSILLYILLKAFPNEIRKKILDRANGVCESCKKNVGRENLTAAHLMHGTKPIYQTKENGRAHCFTCETEYHLKNANNPQLSINMRLQDNDATVYGKMIELFDSDKEAAELLMQKYPKEWQGILRRLKKI